MALLLVQLGPQTAEVLRILGLLVGLTGFALANSLIVVQALTMLLCPALDIPGGMLGGMDMDGAGDKTNSFWGCF